MSLWRIRFQETWGEQTSGYLPDAYVVSEVEGILPGVGADWFPTGFTLSTDADTPSTRILEEVEPPNRRLYLFLEEAAA